MVARGQLTFFSPSLSSDMAAGRHSLGLWKKKNNLSLSTAVHCSAGPIKLKVQFDTAFIHTVDKREGGEGTCVSAFVCR